MVTRPGTRDEIDEFADAIGEWLLTQQFGSIKPLAFRRRMGWDRDEEESYVVIELLVTDPPPPPPREELQRMKTREELAAALTWPLEDWKAVFEAAQAKVKSWGPRLESSPTGRSMCACSPSVRSIGMTSPADGRPDRAATAP